jgi:A/G-specific adenine glycosylase
LIPDTVIAPAKHKITSFQRKLIVWGKKNYRDFPWRYVENKYHSLVAEIMLQRTKAEQVSPVFEEFTRRFKYPSDFINSPDDKLFLPLGLPGRYEQFQKLNEILLHTEIPLRKDELIKLPGVGEYIASSFLSLHCNIRAYLIDSNIVRTYGRYWGFRFDEGIRRKKWFILFCDLLTPIKNHRVYNYALIDFSRSICKSRPRCDVCLLYKRCKFLQKL